MDKLSLLTKHSRRKFLAGAGAVSAATLAAGCGSSTPAAPAPTPTPTPTPVTPALNDNDVLNFALNLEYLEAEFYLRAATGSGLATADQGGSPGAVTGGAMVTGLTTAQQEILNEIAYDEQSHVQYLRKALGSAAVSRPVIDFTNAFPALAKAAGITGTFDPFSNFDSFLVGAFVFEDVGVTAYHGAAGLISSAGIQAGLLGAAASILAVEAYHAAYVRTSLTGRAIAAAAATPATAYPYLDYANAISALRASVGGGMETALVVPTSPSTPSSIVAADHTNAIAYARNTDQVLHIVYGTGGGAGVKSGAFFPSGLNGTIFTTTS